MKKQPSLYDRLLAEAREHQPLRPGTFTAMKLSRDGLELLGSNMNAYKASRLLSHADPQAIGIVFGPQAAEITDSKQ